MVNLKAERYCRVETQVKEKMQQCGRDPEEITLVAVSKNYTWDQVAPVAAMGAKNFGENRVQEALPKITQAPEDMIWHLIGTLQKNKVSKAIRHFQYIHSVDSLELAQKIASISNEMARYPKLFLQVNISGEKSKHGFSPEGLLKQINSLKEILASQLIGLMTIAPYGESEINIRRYFTNLRQLAEELRLPQLSMGMTQDWPIAVEEGATYLRIGSAIFEEKI